MTGVDSSSGIRVMDGGAGPETTTGASLASASRRAACSATRHRRTHQTLCALSHQRHAEPEAESATLKRGVSQALSTARCAATTHQRPASRRSCRCAKLPAPRLPNSAQTQLTQCARGAGWRATHRCRAARGTRHGSPLLPRAIWFCSGCPWRPHPRLKPGSTQWRTAPDWAGVETSPGRSRQESQTVAAERRLRRVIKQLP
jgi:hypothetical protein